MPSRLKMAPHSADTLSVSAAGGSQKKDVPAMVRDPLMLPDFPGNLSDSIPNRAWIMGRDAFEKRMPHHDGIKALWETKWKFPCTKSLYPFHDGLYADFEPIFEHLIEKRVDDMCSPDYTTAFLETAEKLVSQADKMLATGGDKKEASDLYLRACTVYRIARFPYITSRPRINDEVKWKAWEAQKVAYLKAASTWEDPVEEVHVPHVKAAQGEGDVIPVYVRGARAKGAAPVVILMTGLDGYRPDNTIRLTEFCARGWASVTVEIPGTADCPADPSDPAGSERLWDSLIAWMKKDGRFDMAKVMVWGLSSGGYHAVRIAHTLKEDILGVVAQGAGTHHFFDADWLAKADGHEYPAKLLAPMAMKHGYEKVDDYLREAKGRFSLLETGIVKKQSCRLLLINGVLDGLMPIEDSMLLMEHGSPKEARFFPGALHMGYPAANSAVYPWMESVMKYK